MARLSRAAGSRVPAGLRICGHLRVWVLKGQPAEDEKCTYGRFPPGKFLACHL